MSEVLEVNEIIEEEQVQEREKIYLVSSRFYNIQSHKDVTIYWSKGFNLIVGGSDSGKTALHRGLNYNFYNESGRDLIRDNDDGKKDNSGNLKRESLAFVTNIYSNGVSITRKFDKGTNIYEVIDQNGELFVFDGFRNNIPELVSTLSGIKPLVITETFSLNLNMVPSRGMCLLDYNGHEKSQVIGAFANANVIDVAIKEVQAEMKRVNQNISKIEKEIENTNNDIQNLGDMDEKGKLVTEIDELYYSLSEENYLRTELVNLRSSVDDRVKAIKSDKEFLEDTKNIDNQEVDLLKAEQYINELRFKIRDIQDKKSRLLIIKNRIEDRQKEIVISKKILDDTKHLSDEENAIISIEEQVSSLKTNVADTSEKLLRANSLYNSIQKYKDDIKKDKKIVSDYKDLDSYEQKLDDITNELEEYSYLINESQDKKQKLLKIAEAINVKKSNLNNDITFIKNVEVEIKNLINECSDHIKELGKCPLCMSNLDNDHMLNIRKELEEI